VPPGLDTLIIPIVDNAIENRNSIGIIGLLGAVYSGVGWMSSLREALSEQWGQVPEAPPIYKRLVFDLLTLRPIQGAHLIPLTPEDTATGVDGVGGLNVNTIAIQVPIASVCAERFMT